MKTAIKTCSRCKESLPVERFVKNASRWDGLASYCRPCNREYCRIVSKRLNIKALRSRWCKTRGREETRKYKKRFPYKKPAQNAVIEALRKGDLVKPDGCEVCGDNELMEAHHDDYSHPLDVRWLCRLCHRDWHRRNGPGLAPADAKQD